MILNFFQIAANLKTIPRQGWIEKLSIKNVESVADHSYSMAIIGMILSDYEKHNTEKILKMILIHDLVESITGDFTPEQISKNDKIQLEAKTMDKILKHLPKKLQTQYFDLWHEYQMNNTTEAKFVHQIDKLEMAIQAKIYSKKLKSIKNLKPFFDSAKKNIHDPSLLKLFNQISEK